MKRLGFYIAALALAGCIVNDIPYPLVVCRIESIEAEGLSGEPTIDADERLVILPLEETTDIQAVEITACTVTENATLSTPIVGRHNMRTPLYVNLSIYQDYPWTIEARQTIERKFAVEGQIGTTEWDTTARTAKAYVGFEDLSQVTVTALKLGPRDISTMSCTDVLELDDTNLDRLHDFSKGARRVDVTYHGHTKDWYLTVEYTEVKVRFSRIAPWTHSAWLHAEGLSGTKLGFRYRAAGTEEWTEVAQEELTAQNGTFSAQVRGLLPETDYEAVAYSNDDESEIEKFTTEAALPLPNAGFEEWSKPGRIIYPYLSEDQAFWDSGNKGSISAGETICEGSPDVRPGSAGVASACLSSRFASLMGIGKFAAGNIFIGTYAETVGTNGKVNFGRPFATHPIALRGWVKYTQGQIDIDMKQVTTMPPGQALTNDDMDEGSIYIALGTWTPEEYGGTAESPVQVYTKTPPIVFNPNGKDVLGYGELIFKKSTDGWMQFSIEIDWRDTDTRPTHMMIVCSGSRWGDYFVGSTQSRMWVDDFELIYDYADL